MTTKKPGIDWEAVELQYRAGIRSLKDIGREFGVSDVAILKRAKRDDWPRDLKARIQARAEAKVSEAAVRAEVRANQKITERAIIEANAERIAQVRGEHRADIARLRALALKLLGECEAEAEGPGDLAALAELMRNPDKGGKDAMADAYQKAISLPQRIKGVKELAETLRVLVGLEREAYGLSVGDVDPATQVREIRLVAVKSTDGQARIVSNP